MVWVEGHGGGQQLEGRSNGAPNRFSWFNHCLLLKSPTDRHFDDASTHNFIILHGLSIFKIKYYRKRSPKQVTISVLMKEEIVFGQRCYFFVIRILRPGIADAD